MLALLGEGGMGAVYQARDADGRLVAIKVIRPEYAAVAEFRGRFRSEVNRARQVPPFCTAAVLDADPEHETPYLVVEYVDGPNLAEVVADQGPLSGGSLHGVAVGVATALAAIHGARVVHRDLKPTNVLFALGAPKVIDFGIAQALEVTSAHTRTGEVVGTVSYMAPERLDGPVERIGPAVDVFAWGAVVAYAAAGRNPFAGDSPTATAMRILTREPDLDGLSGTLRTTVARALSKDPEERPTATDLLAMLVASDSPVPPALPVAQSPRPVSPPPPPVSAPPVRSAPVSPGPGPRASPPPVSPLRIPPSSPPVPPVSYPPAPAPLIDYPATPVPVPARRSRRAPARRRVSEFRLVAAAVLAAGVIVTGLLWVGGRDGDGTPASAASPVLVLADSLAAPGQWSAGGGCAFDEGLVVEAAGDLVHCEGPDTVIDGDHSITFTVKSMAAVRDDCAMVRFRHVDDTTQAMLAICPEGHSLFAGVNDAAGTRLDRWYRPYDGSVAHQWRIDVAGARATVFLDDVQILAGTLDSRLTAGRLVLGFRGRDNDSRVVFSDLEVWKR